MPPIDRLAEDKVSGKIAMPSPSRDIQKDVKGSVTDIVDGSLSQKPKKKLKKKQILRRFKVSLESKHEILRGILSGSEVEVSCEVLDSLSKQGFLEIMPNDEADALLQNAEDMKLEIEVLKAEMEEDLKLGRRATKRLEHLLKLETDSKSLIRVCGRSKIKKHLSSFTAKYADFNFENADEIREEIKNQSPEAVSHPTREKIRILQSKIDEVLSLLDSYRTINYRHVKITPEGIAQIPEERNLADFFSIKKKMGDVQHSTEIGRNNIAVQMLRLSGNESSEQDEYITRFREIRGKTSRIDCSDGNGRNILTMQLLNWTIESPDKIDEYITSFREIRGKTSLIDCSDSNGRNILTAQLLNRTIESPDKIDEYITRFREMRAKTAGIDCSDSKGRNSLSLQLLDLFIRNPEKSDEYFEIFRNIRSMLMGNIQYSKNKGLNAIAMQFLNLSIENPEKSVENIEKFKKLKSELLRKVNYSTNDGLNNLIMQFLKLQLKNEEKMDSYIKRFVMIRNRISRTTGYSNNDGLNNISMQILMLSEQDPALKFKSFAADYANYRDAITADPDSGSLLFDGISDTMLLLMLSDMIADGIDIGNMDEVFSGGGGQFGGAGGSGDFGDSRDSTEAAGGENEIHEEGTTEEESQDEEDSQDDEGEDADDGGDDGGNDDGGDCDGGSDD